ncbi:flavodoxin family protein [Treponema endosymbiont of Eucomonympha sp.]|uniref:flavodoxin family protein n=1 Tax=Treponema endosymbiont of Eucomonympha sp. TaxID=1580831 RepID=UPI0007832FAA|nr:flavodoxin family protein [Treponema endosymbiont of Eucomonympha sp.]
MKVIALNGSPRKENNTAIALSIMAAELRKSGVETEIIRAAEGAVRGCAACNGCAKTRRCAFADNAVNTAAEKIRAADGLILASPTYYGGINGTMKSFLDRLFYSSGREFAYKAGASITVVRRAGAVDVIHQLNNYLNLAEMVIPPSQYWAVAYGTAPGEITQDAEGVQTLQKHARAMAWLMKSLEYAKAAVPRPEPVQRETTNFIR